MVLKLHEHMCTPRTTPVHHTVPPPEKVYAQTPSTSTSILHDENVSVLLGVCMCVYTVCYCYVNVCNLIKLLILSALSMTHDT